MTGWTRCEPLIAPGGDCGGDAQQSDAWSVRWAKQLPNGLVALVSRAYYTAAKDGDVWLEEQTEYLACTDISDPGTSEVWADYRYSEFENAHPYDAAVTAEGPDDSEWSSFAPEWVGV